MDYNSDSIREQEVIRICQLNKYYELGRRVLEGSIRLAGLALVVLFLSHAEEAGPKGASIGVGAGLTALAGAHELGRKRQELYGSDLVPPSY